MFDIQASEYIKTSDRFSHLPFFNKQTFTPLTLKLNPTNSETHLDARPVSVDCVHGLEVSHRMTLR